MFGRDVLSSVFLTGCGLSELHPVETAVKVSLRQQFFMGAQLHDLTVVDYGNPIRVPDGGKSVSDDDGGSVGQQLL
jgi:hypothetical protein